MTLLDPRTHAYRKDIAARALKDQITAARFVDPTPMTVTAAIASVVGRPSPDAPLTSQLLFGEAFDVYDRAGGYAWGQSRHDGYVGYVPEAALGDHLAATATVSAPMAHLYPEPTFKSAPSACLPFLARVHVSGTQDGFAKVPGGFIAAQHIAPLTTTDPVAIAERFLGVPYLWGGRTSFGLDCSGLIQISYAAVGRSCPRDSDMQMAQLGHALDPDAVLQRGDLVFWKGHVGFMSGAKTLLHANVHHMAVATEPLAQAQKRILAAGDGDILMVRRVAD